MGLDLNTSEMLSHSKERGRVEETVCMWEEITCNYVK